LQHDGDVHAEADAHVRVGELLLRVRRLQQFHVGPPRHGVVRADALVVVVVLDVPVGSLNADVHAFADRAVGQVRVGLVAGRQPDVVDLDLDTPVLQVPILALKEVRGLAMLLRLEVFLPTHLIAVLHLFIKNKKGRP